MVLRQWSGMFSVYIVMFSGHCQFMPGIHFIAFPVSGFLAQVWSVIQCRCRGYFLLSVCIGGICVSFLLSVIFLSYSHVVGFSGMCSVCVPGVVCMRYVPFGFMLIGVSSSSSVMLFCGVCVMTSFIVPLMSGCAVTFRFMLPVAVVIPSFMFIVIVVPGCSSVL